MFTHFHGELKKHLRAVWQYTVNQPAVYAAANMMNTLQHLDALLVDLADVHGNNRPETEDKAASDNKSHKYARTNSLNTLYFDLKSTRNANSNSSINVKPGHYIFELPDSPENRQLIQDIELILHNGQQFDADTKKQKFEMLYRRYLYERNKESGNAADGDAFFRHYLLIGDYIYGTPNLDEFEEEVRQELYEFAKKTFDAVSQSDFLPYSVANIEFKHSRSAFAYSRLKNAHDQIRYKIHSALRLLSSANTLMFFFAPWEISLASGNQEEKTLSLPDSFAQKLEALTKAMNCQRTRFHKEYPHIGLLYDNSPESLRFFADSYNVRCPAVYGSDPLCYTELSAFYEKFSNSGNPFNMMLWEEASLRYEAQMIVLDEIDQTVLLLRKEFEFYPSV